MEEFRQAIMYLSQYTQHARQPTNPVAVSYTHLRAHETRGDLVWRGVGG